MKKKVLCFKLPFIKFNKEKKMEKVKKGKNTKAIHSGQHPDPIYGAVMTPIYQTSTFAFKSAEDGAKIFGGEKRGYIYTRLGNPTTAALEECITDLEGGYKSLATSTGMSAVTTVYLTFLSSGDHIISTDAVYGPSRVVMEKDLARFGIESSYIDTSDVSNIEKAIKPNTKMLYIETPANPTLKLTDIEACAKICKDKGIKLVVDNTFASPILQNPLELGADIVIHSMTKYLNGHSDVVAGIIVTNNEDDYKRVKHMLTYLGGTIDPHQAWLVLRGVKSLGLRVERACKNAMEIAKFLESHTKVERVFYPGLKSFPQYELAKKQMKDSGSMITFFVKGGLEAGRKLMNSVNVATLAVSLGGIETLIQHPASMTHSSVPKEEREASGITDGLVRISIGCEDVEDLIRDLDNALSKI